MANKKALPCLAAINLSDFLDTQDQAGIFTYDWSPCTHEVVVKKDGSTVVKLSKIEIGFYFNPDGRFAGIYNYKD